MKRTLLISCLALLSSFLDAQKIYFIYFQTETGEPFFVRMNDKLYSSTPSGYLILSKLVDSTYRFELGFSGKSANLDFTTAINKKDHGYLIKNFGDKGWGLFDLQSLNVQMPLSPTKGTAQLNSGSKLPVNAFTDMLSKATDDPSLKENVVFIKDEDKKPEAVQTVQREEIKPEATEALGKEKTSQPISQPVGTIDEKKTESAATNRNKIDSIEKQPAVKPAETYKRSKVTRISSLATADGFESVFVDQYENGNQDTVRIFIADQNQAAAHIEAKSDSSKESTENLGASPDSGNINKSQTQAKKEEARKWGIFGKSRNESVNKPASGTEKDNLKKWWPFSKNSGASRNDTAAAKLQKCPAIAVDEDFLKLRRKMAGRTNDDGMLEEAKKYFKTKCFTTEQIKNLSSMFLSNAGKFNFFEIAYNYASDKENFPSLQSELKDEYYINQFKAMLRN